MWALIEQGVMLIHCRNTTFVYHNQFSKYMKVEGAALEDVLIISLVLELQKCLLEKEKKYLLKLFKKWDPEHLQFDDDFDDYLDNDGLKNIIGDEGTQNLNNDD